MCCQEVFWTLLNERNMVHDTLGATGIGDGKYELRPFSIQRFRAM
jgi:hypothetical protein